MSVLEVDPPRLASSGKSVSAAGDALAGAVLALGAALSSSGQMCGDDPAGRAFAQRYRQDGQALFAQAGAAVTATHRVGYGIEMSASNYARSEAASRLGGGTPSVPVPGCPAPFAGPQMADPLGPAVGEPVLWALVSQFVGSPWPDGNPATLRAAAGAWRTFGAAVAGVNGDIEAGWSGSLDQRIPESGQINSAVSQLSLAVSGLEMSTQIASSLDSFASEIETAQQSIRDMLMELSASGIMAELGSIISGHDPMEYVKRVAEDIKHVLHTYNREADAASARLHQGMSRLDGMKNELEGWAKKEFTHFLGDDVGNKVATVFKAGLDFYAGQAQSGFQTAVGVSDLATHPQNVVESLLLNGPATMVNNVVSDPQGFLNHQIEQVEGGLDKKDWADHPLEAAGEFTGNAAQIVIPFLGEFKGAAALGRVGEVSGPAGRAAEDELGGVGGLAGGAGAGSDMAGQASKFTQDLNKINVDPGRPVSAASVEPPEPGPVVARPAEPGPLGAPADPGAGAGRVPAEVPAGPRGGDPLPASPGEHAAPGGGVHASAPAAERPTTAGGGVHEPAPAPAAERPASAVPGGSPHEPASVGSAAQPTTAPAPGEHVPSSAPRASASAGARMPAETAPHPSEPPSAGAHGSHATPMPSTHEPIPGIRPDKTSGAHPREPVHEPAGHGGDDGGGVGHHSREHLGSPWEGQAGEHTSALLPADDSGYRIQPRDCDFLGISPQQVEAWANREAPLGMTPSQFRDFSTSLYDALARDGISAEDLDVRLQGSSARFFSGEHKALPVESDVHPEAQARMRSWLGDDVNRPLRRPFDSMHRLGLDHEPSDYDIQIASDSMVDACRERWLRDEPDDHDMFNQKYGFVDKKTFQGLFPSLWEWVDRWQKITGRPVVPALFDGSGPVDTSTSGVSSHFQDSDWRILPGGNDP